MKWLLVEVAGWLGIAMVGCMIAWWIVRPDFF